MEATGLTQASSSGRVNTPLHSPFTKRQSQASARRCPILLPSRTIGFSSHSNYDCVPRAAASFPGPQPSLLVSNVGRGSHYRPSWLLQCSKQEPEKSSQTNKPKKSSRPTNWVQKLAARWKLHEPLKLILNVVLFFFLIRYVGAVVSLMVVDSVLRTVLYKENSLLAGCSMFTNNCFVDWWRNSHLGFLVL